MRSTMAWNIWTATDEIFVRAWQEEKELYLEVRDNGLGMTEEQVESRFTDTAHVASKRGSGIGVRNVNERIKLYFGAEYGLSIESEPDEEPAVKIHLPAVPTRKCWKRRKCKSGATDQCDME
ncbi:MAG: sensor histidine kinase [Clostridium fessum]